MARIIRVFGESEESLSYQHCTLVTACYLKCYFLRAHGLASVRPNTCRLRRYHFLTIESSFQVGSLNSNRVSTDEGLCFRKREYSIDEYLDLSPVVRWVEGGGLGAAMIVVPIAHFPF